MPILDNVYLILNCGVSENRRRTMSFCFAVTFGNNLFLNHSVSSPTFTKQLTALKGTKTVPISSMLYFLQIPNSLAWECYQFLLILDFSYANDNNEFC